MGSVIYWNWGDPKESYHQEISLQYGPYDPSRAVQLLSDTVFSVIPPRIGDCKTTYTSEIIIIYICQRGVVESSGETLMTPLYPLLYEGASTGPVLRCFK